jgi:AbrB family looped-hinge helix DNA binding protein
MTKIKVSGFLRIYHISRNGLLPLSFANWFVIMATGGVIMQLTIDKFGRIVIPKALRDDLQLTSGTMLEVEEKADHLILRPFHEQPVLMRKNGFLVYTGKPVNSLDTVVKQVREERLLKIAGLNQDGTGESSF